MEFKWWIISTCWLKTLSNFDCIHSPDTVEINILLFSVFVDLIHQSRVNSSSSSTKENVSPSNCPSRRRPGQKNFPFLAFRFRTDGCWSCSYCLVEALCVCVQCLTGEKIATLWNLHDYCALIASCKTKMGRGMCVCVGQSTVVTCFVVATSCKGHTVPLGRGRGIRTTFPSCCYYKVIRDNRSWTQG